MAEPGKRMKFNGAKWVPLAPRHSLCKCWIADLPKDVGQRGRT